MASTDGIQRWHHLALSLVWNDVWTTDNLKAFALQAAEAERERVQELRALERAVCAQVPASSARTPRQPSICLCQLSVWLCQLSMRRHQLSVCLRQLGIVSWEAHRRAARAQCLADVAVALEETLAVAAAVCRGTRARVAVDQLGRLAPRTFNGHTLCYALMYDQCSFREVCKHSQHYGRWSRRCWRPTAPWRPSCRRSWPRRRWGSSL